MIKFGAGAGAGSCSSSSNCHIHVRAPPFIPFPVRSSGLKVIASATKTRCALHAPSSSYGAFSRTGDERKVEGRDSGRSGTSRRRRVFFLDVNPLCYDGTTPSLQSFGFWISLFLSQVTQEDPVIAVLDGERGFESRRLLLPSYKARRKRFSRSVSAERQCGSAIDRLLPVVEDILRGCNIPVIKIEGHEADDVIATLAEQVLGKGYRVVIASPDKDFKQLISEDIQIVMPMAELGRWSFYTLKHYVAQYDCDPQCDLSLRCILGDDVDGVPGIQHLAPAFGRKTALKLLKKHGSLENLLNAAAVRTVGKPYAQDALTKHASYLRRNYEVLALRRNVGVRLEEEWLVGRNTSNDSRILSKYFKLLGREQSFLHHNDSRPPNGFPRGKAS